MKVTNKALQVYKVDRTRIFSKVWQCRELHEKLFIPFFQKSRRKKEEVKVTNKALQVYKVDGTRIFSKVW